MANIVIGTILICKRLYQPTFVLGKSGQFHFAALKRAEGALAAGNRLLQQAFIHRNFGRQGLRVDAISIRALFRAQYDERVVFVVTQFLVIANEGVRRVGDGQTRRLRF